MSNPKLTKKFIKKGEKNLATTESFINYVCEQLKGIGEIRYKKMFGEYLVYIDEKPIVVVCDNTAFVKKLDCIEEDMEGADIGYPYKGAKEHYVLDIENETRSREVVSKLVVVTPVPKKKKKA